MKVKQISVFLNNQKGRLERVTGILASRGIDIKSLCIAETEKYGVLRMLVDHPAEAIQVLRENHVTCEETEVLAVEVEDNPGGLHKVLSVFEDNNLNIEYMYAFVEKSRNCAVMIFKFDDLERAIIAAEKSSISLLSSKKLIEKMQ